MTIERMEEVQVNFGSERDCVAGSARGSPL